MSRLLEVRNKLKRRMPRFIRQDAHKRKRLSQSWRRPKGIHSKMREQIKGRRRSPNIGWGSPRAVSGLTREGFRPLYVQNKSQLAQAVKQIVIARTVGMKKRAALVRKAMEMNLTILNIKDPQAYLADVEKQLIERRKQHKSHTMEKKKADEAAKKAEPQKKEETLEEKEAREKEEKRKVLEGKAP
ncbi:MAG TPA: eL32 family ribosomal protein [Candidatus Nanoarchaeia archaeon]|nr:eL32 family ribosomal protein [Candidatus Nanoarchaeia archaeon]